MGILSNIFSKIFPSAHAEGTDSRPINPPTSTATANTPNTAAPVPTPPMTQVDIDSSLTARKELAKELHYTGDTNDSASMNIWLHRQVMNKVAANGGKVPADLKD